MRRLDWRYAHGATLNSNQNGAVAPSMPFVSSLKSVLSVSLVLLSLLGCYEFERLAVCATMEEPSDVKQAWLWHLDDETERDFDFELAYAAQCAFDREMAELELNYITTLNLYEPTGFSYDMEVVEVEDAAVKKKADPRSAARSW